MLKYNQKQRKHTKNTRRERKDMTKEKAIEKAFDKANLQGESADVYAIIYGYKVLAALPENEIDTIYEAIVKRLGF